MPRTTLYVLVDVDVPEDVLPRIQGEFERGTQAFLEELVPMDDDEYQLVRASIHLDCPSIPFNPPLRIEVDADHIPVAAKEV